VNREARNRLFWKCRRGKLELDLVLEKYLKLYPDDRELEALLDLPDDDLWDIVCGRSDGYEAKFGGVVARLRAA
jgi:antitoxin CptB